MDFKLNLFISPDTIKVKVTETFFLYINWDKLQYLMTDSFISIIFSFFFQKYLFISFFMVCLSFLRNIILKTAAIDNIDHYPTTTTVTASLHGTNILPG